MTTESFYFDLSTSGIQKLNFDPSTSQTYVVLM